ncbi:MAG TPA: CYTH domain-containing protein [Gammaproteobacteria bacterium]|nr:CYTH domain-containing protein [Gammaproteobacteria bacterium]
MGREIELKFLVAGDGWRDAAARRISMVQGYLADSARSSVRVRIAGERAWLNIKGGGLVASRPEFEYFIPADEAAEMLESLCDGPLVEKTRHVVPHGGFEWEVDEFHGRNRGLVVAEIELEHEGQPFERPSWLGSEVTHLARYYNVSLVKRPFSEWSEQERGGEIEPEAVG